MSTSAEERRKRLAASLKENIKRRKQQAQGRQADTGLPPQELTMTPIKSANVLASNLPFSEGIEAGGLIFLSGQLGVLPGTMTLNNATPEAEFVQVMDNIGAVLAANGLGFGHIVKCTIMLADMADWPGFNQVYLRYFTQPLPARSAFGVNGLALGARVEVECIVEPKK
jgi:reactive intermediate/imine deaminase